MSRGAVAIHDWKTLHKQWEKTSNLTLREWCEANSISYTYASKQFTAIEREIEQHNLELARRKLAKTAPIAADAIGELLYSSDDNVKLRASMANLDRVGISPNAMATQVNVQVNLPSMFSNAENQSELKSLLQGELKQDDDIQ